MMVSGDSMLTYEGNTLHHDISRLDLAGRGLAQYPMNNFTKQGYAREEILQGGVSHTPRFFFSAISVSSCSRPVPLTTPRTELPQTIHRRTRNADQ